MENQILENIEKLYRGHIVSTVLYLALIVVVALVTVGVVRFKLLNAKWKNVAFIALVVIASIGLLVIQAVTVMPVYKDYQEQGYIVIEDAEFVIKGGSSVGLDRINYVTVSHDGMETELKMQFDYDLDMETSYRGKIAYLKHSKYLVWYELD